MSRLPVPGYDQGQWGQILNDFLSVAHNSDGVIIDSRVVNAEQVTNKNQPNGYAGLDVISGLSVLSHAVRVGPTYYPYQPGIAAGGPNSAYTIIDKANTASDSTILLRDQGNIRSEIGLAGDNDIHFKTVAGVAGSEVFTDRFIIQTTGDSWFINSLGVGTVPTEKLHVAAASVGARILSKIENTNVAGGSRGTGVQLRAGGVDWSVGTDAGLNGGNNFFIQDNNAGYPPRILIDTVGNVAIGSDTPGYKLDVVGDIASTAVGKGLRIKEGANAKMGTGILIGGSATVSTTAVTANSRVFLTIQTPGGSVGALYVASRSNGVSFAVSSTSGTDTSTFAWLLVEPS